MISVALCQYIGTAILIFHKMPQIYTAFRKRNKLEGFSITKLVGGITGGIFMLIWALGTNNYGVAALNVFHTVVELAMFVLVYRVFRRRRDG